MSQVARQIQAEKPGTLDRDYYQLLHLRGNDARYPMAAQL